MKNIRVDHFRYKVASRFDGEIPDGHWSAVFREVKMPLSTLVSQVANPILPLVLSISEVNRAFVPLGFQ